MGERKSSGGGRKRKAAKRQELRDDVEKNTLSLFMEAKKGILSEHEKSFLK